MSYSDINSHRNMIYDEHRNSLYSKAIHKSVTPDTVVLDLGSGLGLHGLVAAKAGAKKVYLVEPKLESDLIMEIVKANEVGDRVEVIKSRIEETNLPGPVDIIVSVFTGNFLLEEDLLPSLFYARDKYLGKDGIMIPDAARMSVAAVSLPEKFGKYITAWSSHSQNVNFETLRKYAANNIYYDLYNEDENIYISDPEELLVLDLYSSQRAECKKTVNLKIIREGVCHGFLGWFTARLGTEWLSTAPDAPKTHWRQGYMPLDPPISVKPGDIIEFRLQRHEFGEWSWSIITQTEKQKHSTFLSQPFSTRYLQKKSDNNKPVLNNKGEVALKVMEAFNGEKTTLDLANIILKDYPELFPDIQHAKRFIIRLVDRFT